MNIAIKYANGFKWGAFSKGGRQVAQLLSYIFFARFLSPQDFGLMSMALVVIGLGDVFRDFGISSAIIQQKNISDSFLNSIFWVNLSLGGVISLIVFFSSPLISDFYSNRSLIPILQILSVIFFVGNLGSLQRSLFEKEMNFKTVYIIDLITQVFSSLVGVIIAYNGGGIWSIITQTILFYIFSTLLIWMASKWSPSFVLNLNDLKIIKDFSINLTGFNLINFFSRNADYIIIGKFLGSEQLGYYTLAYKIMLYPLQFISDIVNKVTYPIYSKIQDENEKIKNIYKKVTVSIALITMPLMIGLMLLCKPFVLTVFGDKWKPVIVLVMILAPVGIVQSILTTVSPLYLTKGRTDLFFKWGLLSTTFIVLSFFIGINYGIIGTAIAYASVSILLSAVGFRIPFRLINLKFTEFLPGFLFPLRHTLLMTTVILVSNYFTISFLNVADFWQLISGLISGIIAYVASLFIFNRSYIFEIKNILYQESNN